MWKVGTHVPYANVKGFMMPRRPSAAATSFVLGNSGDATSVLTSSGPGRTVGCAKNVLRSAKVQVLRKGTMKVRGLKA